MKSKTTGKVDEITYAEIKAAQSDGINSEDIAEETGISHESAIEIFTSLNWNEYAGIESDPQVFNKVDRLEKGHFRGLIAKKQEENDSLRETRDQLAETVKSLWGMINLLEKRKKQLENDVSFMHSYIKEGASFIERRIEK